MKLSVQKQTVLLFNYWEYKPDFFSLLVKLPIKKAVKSLGISLIVFA